MQIRNFSFRCTLILILISGVFCSCKKTNYTLFDKKYNSVYFTFSNMADTLPTAYFGFMDSDTTIMICVTTSGTLVDTSRHFSIINASPDVSAAAQGNDYTISGNYAIAPNNFKDTIYVHISNHHLSVDNNDKYIYLQIIPNTNFDTIMSPIQATDTVSYEPFNVSATIIKLRITYTTPEPPFWNDYMDYLGDYSQSKMKEFIKITGLQLSFLMSINFSNYYSQDQLVTSIYNFQEYLQEQADSGTPVLDTNETPMQLGEDALVNY